MSREAATSALAQTHERDRTSRFSPSGLRRFLVQSSSRCVAHHQGGKIVYHNNHGLTFFGRSQEPLHNAVKYRGTNHFMLEIFGRFSEIYPTIGERGKVLSRKTKRDWGWDWKACRSGFTSSTDHAHTVLLSSLLKLNFYRMRCASNSNINNRLRFANQSAGNLERHH